MIHEHALIRNLIWKDIFHIEKIDPDKLRKGIMKSGYSNILIVLDEYLDREI